jgi:hypothetical protein
MDLQHIKELLPKHSKIFDSFMKVFLDDFTMYNDMDNHLYKFKFCFQKCIKYGISLNPNKYAFMVFLGMILGFTISKKGKLQDLTKI